MEISVKWFGNGFNVNLANNGNDFLSIKGCRIVSGSKGEFVSYPSQKKQDGSGYWNHVWASEKFNEHILKLAKESQPQQQQSAPAKRPAPNLDTEDIPF